MRPPENVEGTVVDLGDDLLEKTAVLTHVVPSPQGVVGAASSPSIDDDLQSAHILLSEGLTEEAKKVLRRIVMAQPDHVLAQEKLAEIAELELSHLLSAEGRRSRSQGPAPEALDVEAILVALDRDFNLGGVAALSLFQDAKEQKGWAKFSIDLGQRHSELTAQDRIDWGVAFLEMGLLELSIEQFKAAGRESLPAQALLAYSLILAERAFDAAMVLEPIVGDSDVSGEEKIHFFYLMARAQEALGEPGLAQGWYEQVLETDRSYRDCAERIKKLDSMD